MARADLSKGRFTRHTPLGYNESVSIGNYCAIVDNMPRGRESLPDLAPPHETDRRLGRSVAQFSGTVLKKCRRALALHHRFSAAGRAAARAASIDKVFLIMEVAILLTGGTVVLQIVWDMVAR